MNRLRRMLALASVLLTTPGCFGVVGVQYLPERPYYQSYEKLHGMRTRMVKEVHESTWGASWLFFRISEPSVRRIVEKELGDDPNRYVADLNIGTDLNPVPIAGMLFFQLSRVAVHFRVVEVMDPQRRSRP